MMELGGLPDVVFRLMRADDAEAVIALKWEMNLVEHARMTAGDLFAGDLDLSREAAAAVAGNYMVAMEGGQGAVIVAAIGPHLVGYLAFTVDSASASIREDVREHGFVSGLFVTRAHRSRGIGTALLRQAEAFCRERGLKRLMLTVAASNPDGQRLYTREGFHAISHVMLREIA